jgi:N-carbamoylputrescine amidase
MNPFTIGVVQDHAGVDPRTNHTRAEKLIREAARQGAQIVCLKELFGVPYFCKAEESERFDLSEPIPGPTTDAMQALARELAVVLVVPLFERQAPGIYRNSAAVIDADGSLLGVYRKMHIPDDPLYYEKYYFTPGDGPVVGDQDRGAESPAPRALPGKVSQPVARGFQPRVGGPERTALQVVKPPSGNVQGFKVWKTRYATIGVLICWDQWYPEAARITSLLGAQVLFYPTAIGWHPMEKAESGAAQVDAWRTAQRAHAIANGVYVAAPNRIGHEDEPGTDGITFFGRSFIADPFGRYLAEAGEAEEILIARCDPAVIETVRRHWPFLRDRRVDAYGPILSRYLGS